LVISVRHALHGRPFNSLDQWTILQLIPNYRLSGTISLYCHNLSLDIGIMTAKRGITPRWQRGARGDFLNNMSSQLWTPYYVWPRNLRCVFSEPGSARTRETLERSHWNSWHLKMWPCCIHPLLPRKHLLSDFDLSKPCLLWPRNPS